ncbi:MAG: hypothetical protein JXR96_09550 [Deltaproteobacteria bacterium]|nr:hypothetical protein [Deltaproteobacteria bacterium]
MSFKEELEAICRQVPGSRAAMVMSMDGIVVMKSASGAEVDIESLGVEIVGPLKLAAQAVQNTSMGDLATLELETQTGTLLVRQLLDEYFVALLLGPGALVGKGRYVLRVHGQALKDELS